MRAGLTPIAPELVFVVELPPELTDQVTDPLDVYGKRVHQFLAVPFKYAILLDIAFVVLPTMK